MKLLKPASAVLIAAAAAVFYFYWTADARVVRRSFDKMLDSLEIDGPESLTAAALRVDRTVSFFAPDAVIDPGEPFPRHIDKPKLKMLLLSARRQASYLRARAVGYEIQPPGEGAIEMEVTISARAGAGGYEDASLGTFRVAWIRDDGDWKIRRIEPLQIVIHPDSLPVP